MPNIQGLSTPAPTEWSPTPYPREETVLARALSEQSLWGGFCWADPELCRWGVGRRIESPSAGKLGSPPRDNSGGELGVFSDGPGSSEA